MTLIEKAVEKWNASADKKVAQKWVDPVHDVSDMHDKKERSSGVNSDLLHLNLSALSPSGVMLPSALIADEYRKIKRPLLANAFGNEASLVPDGHVIMVTSSLPNEGKSFTAIHLALSIAKERDCTVLLVDGDVTKSQVTKMTHLSGRDGLVELLSDEHLCSSDVIVKTDYTGLSILPSGHSQVHTAELLASNRMGALIKELSASDPNRIILFDAPPLLATPETQILSDHMGQVVFVVEMGVTPKAVVEQALSLLDNEEKAVGLILNKARKLSGDQDYYGYGYGVTDS
ncbi:MAG: protein tyrosine kinase [Gammaproteobacteria bacterium]|nr:protein tyrosine kinase [Gammaproteobacteria bacterium]